MDKITKNPPENTKQSRKRFAIIPLKKHLAKFIIIDWDRITPLIPKSETDEYIKSLTNPRKLGKYKIERLFSQERSRENVVIRYIIKFCGQYFFDEELLINDSADVTIKYYTNRRNLNQEFLPFIQKGYTLVKITAPVKKVSNRIELRHWRAIDFQNKVKEINEIIESKFMQYIDEQISPKTLVNTGNIDKILNELYAILGLNEIDVKKTTLKRAYYRYKKDNPDPDIDFDERVHIHNKIGDKQLFEIYQEHFENNVSYSILASKYKLSKSAITRVCNNPKVMDLYKKVVRYHNSHIDWFLNKGYE